MTNGMTKRQQLFRALMAPLVLVATLAGGAGQSLAADLPEPFLARIEAVSVAGRQIQASGQLYALSSTVVITNNDGGAKLGLQDLYPDQQVLIVLGNPGEELPVIKSLAVILE